MANDYGGSNIVVTATGATFTSMEMIVPEGGINIIISNLTSGNVWLEEFVNATWTQTPTNKWTANASVYVPIAPGRKIRVTGDTIVGACHVEVVAGAAFFNYTLYTDLASDVATNTTDISVVADGIRNIAIINMAGGDYTMTVDEANAPVKVITGDAAGKILTVPSTAFATMPAEQMYVTFLASHAITLKLDDGPPASTKTIAPFRTISLACIPGVNIITIYNISSGTSTVNAQSGASYDLIYSDQDCLISFSHAGATTAVISDANIANMTDGATFYIQATGTCSLSLSNGGGAATFTGLPGPFTASSGIITVKRSDESNSFYVG